MFKKFGFQLSRPRIPGLESGHSRNFASWSRPLRPVIQVLFSFMLSKLGSAYVYGRFQNQGLYHKSVITEEYIIRRSINNIPNVY